MLHDPTIFHAEDVDDGGSEVVGAGLHVVVHSDEVTLRDDALDVEGELRYGRQPLGDELLEDFRPVGNRGVVLGVRLAVLLGSVESVMYMSPLYQL